MRALKLWTRILWPGICADFVCPVCVERWCLDGVAGVVSLSREYCCACQSTTGEQDGLYSGGKIHLWRFSGPRLFREEETVQCKKEGAEYLSHTEEAVALRTFWRHGTSCCLRLDAAASILILQPSRRCIHDVQALMGAVEFPALVTYCM